MRIPARLLVLPLLVLSTERSILSAQVAASTPILAPADNSPMSVRCNRLVPRFVDENTASRRAARKAAAGDTAALRRIAQTPPPFLFRIYALLSVAQYAAVNSAHDDRAVSSDAAVASASAAVLSDLFTDSTVRASIARELERNLARAGSGSRGAERAMAGKRLGEDGLPSRDGMGTAGAQTIRTLERHHPEGSRDVVQRSGDPSDRNLPHASAAMAARLGVAVPAGPATGLRFGNVQGGTRGGPTRCSRADC